ncbi:Protein of unknown function [Gryllus bimaculatus]|nr:Protein of unknown function [Gryllus bimaculatus]
MEDEISKIVMLEKETNEMTENYSECDGMSETFETEQELEIDDEREVTNSDEEEDVGDTEGDDNIATNGIMWSKCTPKMTRRTMKARNFEKVEKMWSKVGLANGLFSK